MEQRSASDVLKFAKDNNVEIVDVRFCDLPGLMQHFSAPAHELTEDVFENGLGFDGSSTRGFQRRRRLRSTDGTSGARLRRAPRPAD